MNFCMKLLEKVEIKEIEKLFQKCLNQHQLIVAKNQIIGRNAPLIKEFNNLNKAEKIQLSKKVQAVKEMVLVNYKKHLKRVEKLMVEPSINNNFEKQHAKLKNNEYYNSLLNKNINFSLEIGKAHPLIAMVEKLHTFCQQMNWRFIPSSDLVSFEENFALLNIDPDHPAIGTNDCFIIDSKNWDWQIVEKEKQPTNVLKTAKNNAQWVLRTHTTNMTARELVKYSKNQQTKSVYTIGNVYRNDTDDNTHLKQFMQLDVCLIQPKLSLANLKWILIKFCEFIFDKKTKFQFRNSFFPFTEPSIELDIKCPFCHHGCSTCDHTGWIELLGAGMIAPKVLKRCQIKEGTTALAFGVGVERIAMLKNKIKDIRLLYQNNLYFQ